MFEGLGLTYNSGWSFFSDTFCGLVGLGY